MSCYRYCRSLAGRIVYYFPLVMMRTIVANSVLRSLLNYCYLKFSFKRKNRFHSQYWRIFRSSKYLSPGSWLVEFAGSRIYLPLRHKNSDVDWVNALSILGYDIEVKQTYASLITSKQPPDLFVDIGANYGTHSLLFLANKIPAISFEPNPACHQYFHDSCALNNVTPWIEKVALGDRHDYFDLMYPEGETWLGSLNSDVNFRLKQTNKVISLQVEQKTLDDYLPHFSGNRVLIKIDTEGNEYQVLQGAVKTLNQCRPILIFESWPQDKPGYSSQDRIRLHEFFINLRYSICPAPWIIDNVFQSLDRQQFIASMAENFVAVPEEKLSLKELTAEATYATNLL